MLVTSVSDCSGAETATSLPRDLKEQLVWQENEKNATDEDKRNKRRIIDLYALSFFSCIVSK